MQTGGWIGDMILLTPALRALKKGLHDANITVLVNPLVKELMERNPYLDSVIVYDKRGTQKGIRGMWKMADRLKLERFDIAVILHPNSVRSAILSYMAGIPERVGSKIRGRGPFLTMKVAWRRNVHEVQRYLDVVSSIVNVDRNGKLEFWGIREEDETFVNDVLGDHTGPVVGINPFTTWPSKRWPVERFARLVDLISCRFDTRVVLTGDIDDAYLGSKLMKQVSSKPINLIGHTTLWQLGALIKHCHLYVTCDSGPMHISAALGTPTVSLFGPTDPVRHSPYGQGHTVVRKKTECAPCYKRKCKSYDCMQAIQIEDVVEAIAERFHQSRPEYNGSEFV